MKGLLQRILHSYRFNFPLRQKLLASNFFVIVIPLAVLSLFASHQLSSAAERRARYAAERSLEQADSYLSYMMYNVGRVSELIFLSSSVNSILSAQHRDYTISEQLRDGNVLRNYLFTFQDGINVEHVRLYLPSAFVYSIDNVNIFPLSDATNTKWYRALERSQGGTLWCPSSYLQRDPGGGAKLLSLARFMVDQNNLLHRVGVLRVDFSERRVSSILRKADAIRGSVTYVVDSAGMLVAASDPRGLDSHYLALARRALSIPDDGTLRPEDIAGVAALAGARPLPSSQWRMVTVVPLGAIVAAGARVRYGIFIVMVIVMLIATSLSYLVSGSITRRISELIGRMQNARSGGLRKLEPEGGSDEVGQLQSAYNEMTDRIHALIEDEAQARQRLKNAELEALQAQINPHFLYNTLDLINWLTKSGSAAEVDSVVKWLANFYRLSLSDGRTLIPIRDELEHVTLYYRIQNLRFRGALKLEKRVDESLLDKHILKTTLQPLVENAILHGVRERSDKSGSILISGESDGDDILLSVADDGVGIPLGRQPSLLDGPPLRSPNGSAFGVRNIHERIRLKYGPSYGLSFSSYPGRGTTVTVRIRAE